MPTQERKYYIMKHNQDVEKTNEEYKQRNGKQGSTTSGDLNAFAATEQYKARNQN